MLPMFPRDAFAYLDAPVEVDINTNTGTPPFVLAAPDPDRVLLIIHSAFAPFKVSTVSDASWGGGILVGNTLSPLIMSWWTHGGIVQSGWYCNLTPGGDVTVITQTMTRNPEDAGWRGIFAKKPGGQVNLARYGHFGASNKRLSPADSKTVSSLLRKYGLEGQQ